jgi:hypothetical protein
MAITSDLLTASEIETFVEAVNDIHNANIEAEFDVVVAAGSLDQFIAKFGRPMESNTADNGSVVHYWRAAQAQKGDQRRDIALIDFGGDRVAYTHSA